MSERTKIIVAVIVGIAVGIGAMTALRMVQSAVLSSFDNPFGDQWLKTGVALIELHRVRYGQYPESLSDLKFIGQWDPMAIQSISYKVNDTHTRYCLEPQRGLAAKPPLSMPAEFWQNTGYDPALCR